MANLIDSNTGLKIDLSVLEHTTYYDEVMARRVHMPFGPQGPSFYVVTAEDIILMKLLWRRESRSQKQWSNALSVARVKRATLDWKYLWEQACSLGIKDDLVNAGALWVDSPAFREGNLVWGRIVADIPDFCRELVAALVEAAAAG